MCSFYLNVLYIFFFFVSNNDFYTRVSEEIVKKKYVYLNAARGTGKSGTFRIPGDPILAIYCYIIFTHSMYIFIVIYATTYYTVYKLDKMCAVKLVR